MHQVTREKNRRVVFRFDGKGASPIVIHHQVTSLESAWLANGVENTGNASAPISATVSVGVPAEVRPIIVRVYVQLDPRLIEIDAEKFLDFRQDCQQSSVESRRRLYGAGKAQKISVAGHGTKFTVLIEDPVDYVLRLGLGEKVDDPMVW